MDKTLLKKEDLCTGCLCKLTQRLLTIRTTEQDKRLASIYNRVIYETPMCKGCGGWTVPPIPWSELQ